MAISNEGYNPKVWTNFQPAGTTIFLKYFGLEMVWCEMKWP